MQTTLLGFAVAIILALLVALIGPFVVDWTQFRPVFEAEASRIMGVPVRVTGAIDARLLPTPSLSLHGLEIGPTNDPGSLRARALNVEFALGPLLRGELRASQAHLIGPEFTVGLNKAGGFELPRLPLGIGGDLSIDRLHVEDGRAHLVDAATGSRITLDKLWFNGDVRSLAGPFKGEGAFVSSGELYGYRISSGRLGDDGRLRLRVSLDPSDRELTAEADGSLIVGDGKPRFEGSISLSRPVSLVDATGQSKVKLPWRITSSVKADTAGAKFEDIDFLYGAEDSGVHLTGTADLRFGPHPRFKGVFTAAQLDLDRLIATSDKPTRLPTAAVQAFLAGFAQTLQPPIPAELSFSADTITLAGAPLQLFGADLRIDDRGWTLDRVEFRAPGLSQVKFSGRLDLSPSLAFNGPVSIETNEPGVLAAWFDGVKEPASPIKPFRARGDVVLNSERIAIEHLRAEIDHEALHGQLHYAFAAADHPSHLDAKLDAPEIDLDSLIAMAGAVRSGTRLKMPSEVSLNAAIGRATIAGVTAKDVKAQIKRDANGLRIEQLSVADFGGARMVATGKFDTSGAAPRGSFALDFQARKLDGVMALVEKYAPKAAAPLRRAAARVPNASLRLVLSLDAPGQPAAGADATARFALEGTIGALRASVHGEARQDAKKAADDGELAAFSAGDIRLYAQMDGADGGALVALLGLGKAVAVGDGPGFVYVSADGKVDGALKVESRMVAGGLVGKAAGTASLFGAQGPSADLELDIKSADIRPLAGTASQPVALPLTLRGHLSLNERGVKLDARTATLAGTDWRGTLTFGFGTPLRIGGTLDIDTVDARALIAAAIGAPVHAKQDEWSADPYGPGQFTGLEGRVDVKIMRAALTSSLGARQVHAGLVFHDSGLSLDKLDAEIAGGRLTGSLSFHHGSDGLAVRARIEAKNLDAAVVLPSGARPAVGGRLTAKLDLQAAGLTPRALIGSLAGSGTVSLSDGYFSSLDPNAFATVIRASDQGLAGTPAKVHSIVAAALDSGRLPFATFETALTIDAGQVRATKAVAEANSAALSVSGSFDLIRHSMDVRLTLAGTSSADASSGRPDIFVALRGPVPTPQRTIDVSALAGWLTIRRVEQQAKKLEALEKARREALARENDLKARTMPPDIGVPTVMRSSAPSIRPEKPAVAVVPGAATQPRPRAASPHPLAATSVTETPVATIPMAEHPSALTAVPSPRPAQALAPSRPTTPKERTAQEEKPRRKPTALGPPLLLAPPLPAPVEIKPSPSDARRSEAQPQAVLPDWMQTTQPQAFESLVGTPQ